MENIVNPEAHLSFEVWFLLRLHFVGMIGSVPAQMFELNLPPPSLQFMLISQGSKPQLSNYMAGLLDMASSHRE